MNILHFIDKSKSTFVKNFFISEILYKNSHDSVPRCWIFFNIISINKIKTKIFKNMSNKVELVTKIIINDDSKVQF